MQYGCIDACTVWLWLSHVSWFTAQNSSLRNLNSISASLPCTAVSFPSFTCIFCSDTLRPIRLSAKTRPSYRWAQLYSACSISSNPEACDARFGRNYLRTQALPHPCCESCDFILIFFFVFLVLIALYFKYTCRKLFRNFVYSVCVGGLL